MVWVFGCTKRERERLWMCVCASVCWGNGCIMSRIYQILITAALLQQDIYTLENVCMHLLYRHRARTDAFLYSVYILIGATNSFFFRSWKHFNECNGSTHTRVCTRSHTAIWYRKLCYIRFWLPHIMPLQCRIENENEAKRIAQLVSVCVRANSETERM